MLIINTLSESHSRGQIIDITHTVNMITIELVRILGWFPYTDRTGKSLVVIFALRLLGFLFPTAVNVQILYGPSSPFP